jgi:flavin reductase (DIM6/NTAB) family NADH-FMN oxidoreductase RutF
MTNDALQDLAPALGRLPSGLCILTARHGERETGMLVSWVQQCSFEPPQVTAAVRRGRDVLAWLEPGAAFTLNILAEGQTNLLSHFGKGFALDQPSFNGLKVERRDGLGPILSDAMGYLACKVSGRVGTGDHELVIGTVEGGKMLLAEGKPYVHVRKNGLRY